MRLLFLASSFPRFSGDPQVSFVLDQARAWKVARPNDDVIMLGPHDAKAPKQERIFDVAIRRFQYFYPARLQALAYPAILPNLRRNPVLLGQVPPFLWAEYRAARRIVSEQKIDLIYAHWVMPQGLVAHWLSRRTGVRYVLHNHSSDLAVFSRLGGTGLGIARRVIEGSRVMFCVNSKQKDFALSLFAPSAREAVSNKIVVLPMGTNLSDVPSGHANARFRYRMGTISRLTRKKGIDLFILAANLLARKGSRVPICIAGDGEDRERLQSLLSEADVRFVGFVSGEDKMRLFEETEFFVFASVATGGDVEGLPVSVMEALCRGKVVIASRDTNVELLPEWDQIKSDVFLLADPQDIDRFAAAMRSMLSLDPSEIARRSMNLRTNMAHYRWDNLIKSYESAIQSALGT